MSKKTNVVPLIESSRASGWTLLNGVAKNLHYHGPWSFYCELGGSESAWPLLKTLDADGTIRSDADHLQEVPALDIPAIVIDHKRQEASGVYVVTDSRPIGITTLGPIGTVHTEQICQMLFETTLSMDQIAKSLRSAREMRPLAYRNSFGKQTHKPRAQNGESFSQTGATEVVGLI